MSGILSRLFGKKPAANAGEEAVPPAAPAKPIATPQQTIKPDQDAAAKPELKPRLEKYPEPSLPSKKTSEPDPIAMLRAIHEVLNAEEEPMVTIPGDALLRRLPPNLRGPAWKADGVPNVTFRLTISSVMEQLAKGRLVYPLSEFIVDVPEGWLAAHAKPDMEVELDLPRVVQAMPKGSFKSKTQASALTPDVNQIRDFFAPGAAVAATPDAASPDAPAKPPVEAAAKPDAQEPVPVSEPAASPDAPAKPPVEAEPVQARPAALPPLPPVESAAKPDAQEPAPVSEPAASPDAPAKPPVEAEPVQTRPAALPPLPPVESAAKPDAQEPVPVSEPVAKQPDAALASLASGAIRNDEETMLRIPCAALLLRLPEELRGPAWQDAAFPKDVLEMPQSSILQHLASGRIAYPLSEFLADVPDGWIAADARPDAVVELDLACVVQAIPKEKFASRPQTLAVSEEMIRMRDMFVPQATGVTSKPTETDLPSVESGLPPRPVSVVMPVDPKPGQISDTRATDKPALDVIEKTLKTPAKPRSSLPKPTPGPAWDGVDLRADAGPNIVDLNRAGAFELSRLPGVGAGLAEAILAYRREHGPFKSVFDLAEVEGIGPKTFTMITGVSLATRQDRHEILNAMLGLAQDARPSLVEIAASVAALLGVHAVVFSSLDGMMLACSGATEERAGIYAAIVPQMFRRTRRYLRQLLNSRVQAMAIPLSNPPLLLVDAGALFIVVALAEGQDFDSITSQALEVARELHWLLDFRAVVRPTA